METIIFIYIFLGLLINIVGPLKKSILEEKDMKYSASPKWKKITIVILMRLTFLIFNPIFYITWLIDLIKHKNKPTQVTKSYNENYLYFFHMGGAGTVYCKDCDFSKDIVSFLHGFGVNSPTDTGYQCQNCGEFHVIKNDINNSKKMNCSCGGNLDKEKPLFCPKCKSKNLNYELDFIT